MAKPSFAEVDELGDWLGESLADPVDSKRAESMLAMASELVRVATGKSWVDDDDKLLPDLPDALGLVTKQAAARAYMNPQGKTSTNESIDDWITGERYKVEEAGVYLTASERDMLEPLAGRRHRGLGTVSTYRGDIPRGGDCFPVVNSNWRTEPWDD